MAIRSLIVSTLLTGALGYALTVGLTSPQSVLKKLPDWTAIPILFVGGLLYLLATWWAIRGFGANKWMALISLGFCAIGLSCYALGFSFVLEKGKARPGQYQYDFSALNSVEKAVLNQLVQDIGLQLNDAQFTEHWHVADTSTTYRICVQQGHVTALNISGHPIHHVHLLSQLPYLGDLYVSRCSLSTMSGLQSAHLDRLDISDNQLTDLTTLQGCPNLRWLFAQNNQLRSTAGLEQFKQLVSSDFSGNPFDHR